MQEIIDQIKKDVGNSSDFIYREIEVDQKKVTLVFNEVLSSSEDINEFVLKYLAQIIEKKIPILSLYTYFMNSMPGHHIKEIKDYKELIDSLYNGYTIVITNNQEIFGVETKMSLDRGIGEAQNEQSLQGPKDAFTENFNKNLGLVRKRIKSKHLWLDALTIGKETKTKVGLIYMENIVEDKLVQKVKKRLQKINVDGIIDSGYIKEELEEGFIKIFPTILSTERPDLVSMALLEGKLAIIVDNSPYVLIIPCFLIDLFHTSDDYYQKPVNITFIRIIRLFAFLIAIFIPAFYIAVTTHNQEALTLDLLINFTAQREMVPFPALIEALLMGITFEILRESDTRMPSSMGTAVSILGGLVLGDAAVNAGIVSPIMIIVIAISAISGLLFSSIEMISAIRFWRFLLLFLATLLGIYGIFLGGTFLIIHLASLHSFGKPYLAPFAPYVPSEQRDALIKTNPSKVRYRNPLLTSKNKVRGRSE